MFKLRDSGVARYTLVGLLFRSVSAVQFFNNATVPTNITSACSDALLTNVTSCGTIISSLRPGNYYPESVLSSACTSDCTSGLSSFASTVSSACSADIWNGYENTTMPLAIIPDLLRYAYNLTCLMDSGRYCNVVAAQYAYSLDPASGNPSDTSDIASSSDNSTTTAPVNATNPCDLCLIKNLQFEAASPYFDGPFLQDSSIYESKTASCGVTGLPLVTVTQNIYTPTAPSTATATPTCGGKSYTIQSGDTCNSIAKSQGISTIWLLSDNNLQAYCSQFPANGTLCLVNTCKVYTTKTNDTCDSIASANNITEAQFKAWNPVINAGCYNLNTMIGMEFCIGAPGTPYAAPNVTVLAPSTASIAAPIPTNVAADTTTDCGEYYEAVLGDYCNMIVIKFSISLDDFVFLNPAINANCTNLFAYESYCVEAVGDINTYSGRPGYTTVGPTNTATAPSTPYSALANATYTTPSATTTAMPLASGTRTDCNGYFEGDVFNDQDISGTNWNSSCELAAAVYNVDLDDFAIWNPSLGDTTLSNCTFSNGVQYCGKLYFGDSAAPSIPTSSLPIRDGTTTNCTQYADVTSGWMCQDILDQYDLTIAQFYAYNSEVGSDCSNLWADYQYCIRTPDYVDQTQPSSSTTSSSPTTTSSQGTSATPTSPVQSGQPTNCNTWYTAQSGDSCNAVESTYFITSAQFLAWNPAVSSDCTTGFWLGYAYCVGTTDTISSTRVSTTAPSTTTTAAAQPTPIQPNNVVSNCNKYAQALNGDSCSTFASDNNITPTQLYSWNSVLGSDGSNCATELWASYYYCVGVSS